MVSPQSSVSPTRAHGEPVRGGEALPWSARASSSTVPAPRLAFVYCRAARDHVVVAAEVAAAGGSALGEDLQRAAGVHEARDAEGRVLALARAALSGRRRAAEGRGGHLEHGHEGYRGVRGAGDTGRGGGTSEPHQNQRYSASLRTYVTHKNKSPP